MVFLIQILVKMSNFQPQKNGNSWLLWAIYNLIRPLLSNKFVFTVTPTFPPAVTGFFLAFLESHYNNEPSFCQPLKPPEMTPYVNAQEI